MEYKTKCRAKDDAKAFILKLEEELPPTQMRQTIFSRERPKVKFLRHVKFEV